MAGGKLKDMKQSVICNIRLRVHPTLKLHWSLLVWIPQFLCEVLIDKYPLFRIFSCRSDNLHHARFFRVEYALVELSFLSVKSKSNYCRFYSWRFSVQSTYDINIRACCVDWHFLACFDDNVLQVFAFTFRNTVDFNIVLGHDDQIREFEHVLQAHIIHFAEYCLFEPSRGGGGAFSIAIF